MASTIHANAGLQLAGFVYATRTILAVGAVVSATVAGALHYVLIWTNKSLMAAEH